MWLCLGQLVDKFFVCFFLSELNFFRICISLLIEFILLFCSFQSPTLTYPIVQAGGTGCREVWRKEADPAQQVPAGQAHRAQAENDGRQADRRLSQYLQEQRKTAMTTALKGHCQNLGQQLFL